MFLEINSWLLLLVSCNALVKPFIIQAIAIWQNNKPSAIMPSYTLFIILFIIQEEGMSFFGCGPPEIVKILFPPKSSRNENYSVITIKKCIRNRILKCGSDPKQERRRGKGNDVNADLMSPCDESNISIEEETKNEPQETLKPSIEALVNEHSDGFKEFAQNERELVAVAQLENSTKKLQQQNEATLLPTRFVVEVEERNTEKKSVCLNEMEIQSKSMDELLQKAEQVIRLLEAENK
jgi:hypothetical protein